MFSSGKWDNNDDVPSTGWWLEERSVPALSAQQGAWHLVRGSTCAGDPSAVLFPRLGLSVGISRYETPLSVLQAGEKF